MKMRSETRIRLDITLNLRLPLIVLTYAVSFPFGEVYLYLSASFRSDLS